MTNYPQTRQDDTEISAWNAAANMHGNTGNGTVPFLARKIADWRAWGEEGYQLGFYQYGGMGISAGSGRNKS